MSLSLGPFHRELINLTRLRRSRITCMMFSKSSRTHYSTLKANSWKPPQLSAAQVSPDGSAAGKYLLTNSTPRQSVHLFNVSTRRSASHSATRSTIPVYAPAPTDELVRKIIASDDMKRILGRELRKCSGNLDNLNYGRITYDSWNGFTERIILEHVHSEEKLIQLIREAMAENPAFKGYVETTLDPRNLILPAPFGPNLLHTKNLTWYLTGAALLLAFFNYYLTAVLLYLGAVYLTFYIL